MKWVALFFIVLNCNKSNAQSFQYKLYSTKEGLSSNKINTIVKDDKGFIWIASQNGLNRFDGNAFDVFYNNPTDSTSIGSNYVQSLFISTKKQLWIGTESGLSTINTTTQQFSNYAPDTVVMPKQSEIFPCINEDAAGNIWLGSRYDLLLFNPNTKKFKSSGWANYVAKVKPANGNHRRVIVLSIVKKSSNEFWVLTSYGLFSVNAQTLAFTYYPYTPFEDYFGSAISYVDEQNNLWISTYNRGILFFNTAGLSYKNYHLPKNFIDQAGWDNCNSIDVYNKDTLIIAANNSIVFFDKGTKKFTSYISSQNNTDINFLPSGIINIKKDNNCFWINSDNGLLKMQQQKRSFNYTKLTQLHLVHRLFFSASTKQLVIGDFFTKSIYYNATTKKITILKTNPKAIENGARFYLEINKDTAYLCTDQNLYLVNPTTYQIKEIPLPQKRVEQNPNTIRNIVVDKYGMLWIRFREQGIYQFNPKTQQGSYATFIPSNLNTFYTALYYDKVSNSLFVGVGLSGVYIYDIDKKTVQKKLLNIPPSQRGAIISCVVGNSKGEVFLADEYNGLFVYTHNTKKWDRYTITDGLQSNICKWLCIDGNGLVWIATNIGVSCFNPTTHQFKNFDKEQNHIGVADHLIADSNGLIYQPWGNNIISWQSKIALQTKPIGKIYLRYSTINEKNIAIDSVYNFTANQNNISFQFGYLLQNNDDAIRFEYTLSSNNWLSINNSNKLSFSNLSPNKYLLQIREKATPNNIFTIRFTIHPPYYKTWWFILLALLLGFGLVYSLIKNRIKSIKKQANLKQQIAETEMMALRAQMNPHFIFNAISSIDNFILDNDATNASNYLNKFAKLIRNILDNSKNAVVPFWKDWETLNLYLQLEQLRSNDSFTYALHADEKLINGHYKIPPLIIQPYIENAIHHGLKPLQNKKGVLTVTATIKNNTLQYTISDNGIGRKKAAENSLIKTQHQSYGMQLTEQRIDLFNNQQQNNVTIQDVEEKNNIGTIVTVFLKV